jgi:hypothetical protein
MEWKAQNTIYASAAERKFPFGGNRERDNWHFARGSHFADLVESFVNALSARLEAGRRKEAVRRHDHKIEIFSTGFVRKFINANGLGGLDGGAIVADVEDHDFDQIADTAIRIANQKVERFHQFEKMQPPGGMGGMRAFLAVAKQALCQLRSHENAREWRKFPRKMTQKCTGPRQKAKPKAETANQR